MRDHSSLDRDSFQQLLASAFAVQESQIDSQSLSAILEIQRLIAKRELDVDGAMRLIVEGARGVANATGVAVGLLKGDQLTYRACSGSAASDVGRQMRASLTFSADAQATREILRVENVQADTRIQAAICRQFGATSLLILPICQQQLLAGVFEVRFSEAHTFQERELRAYRLMAGLVEEALSQAAQQEQKQLEQKQAEQKRKLTQMPVTPPIAPQMAPQREKLSREKFPNNASPTPLPAIKPAIYQHGATALAMVRESVRESAVLKQPALLATAMVQRANQAAWSKQRSWALAAVVVVLGFTLWIAYKSRVPVSPLGSSSLSRSTTIEQEPVPFRPAKATLESDTTTLQTAPALPSATLPARATGRRVRVSENEVDYIRGDVTVRYFTYKKPAPPRQTRVADSHVTNIGGDVTVRYFPPAPAAKSASR